MQFALRSTYYLAWWCIVTVLSLLAAAVSFMVAQNARFDDDIIWFAGIPVGLLLFVPAARWALRFRRLHGYLLGIGGVGVIAAVTLGIVLVRRSEALKGVTGPFAGTGELIAAVFLLCCRAFLRCGCGRGSDGHRHWTGPNNEAKANAGHWHGRRRLTTADG